MPESCMPMLTTAMVMSCQRTQLSVSRPQTETVWIEERDRSSSCISSTSAWMSPLLRYHFKAVTKCERRVTRTSRLPHSSGDITAPRTVFPTCDGGVSVFLFDQQIAWTLWKPRQQHQLDDGGKDHQGQEERPVLFLCTK